jgi:AraC-like DNA-binding protein
MNEGEFGMASSQKKWSYKQYPHNKETLVPELVWVGYANYKEANRLAEHVHEASYEFVYIDYGKVIWEVEGILYETSAGHVFYSKPDEWHRPRFNNIEPCRLWYIVLRDPKLDPGWLGLTESERTHIAFTLNNLPRTFHTQTNIRDAFLFLKQCIEHQDEIAALKIRHAILRLLFHFLYSKKSRTFTDDLQISMMHVVQNIQHNPEHHWTIAELASLLGVSDSHVYRLFREIHGESPIAFIQRYRIEMARKLLCNQDISITEVAMELGFLTSQHFATSFKRYTGVTPRQWRTTFHQETI